MNKKDRPPFLMDDKLKKAAKECAEVIEMEEQPKEMDMNKRGDIYDNFIKWYDSYSERPSKYTIAGHFTREVKREKQAVAKEILDVIEEMLNSEIAVTTHANETFGMGKNMLHRKDLEKQLKPLMKKYKYKE